MANMSNEHLAELLSGIARAQNAIIDAVERANGGWKNNHMIPMLNTAANIRAAEPRLLDLPSRILMRLQGRAAIDNAVIVADLERLFALPAGTPATAPAPVAVAMSARAVATAGTAPAAPAAPAVSATPAIARPAMPAAAVSVAPAAPRPATPAAAAPAAPRPPMPAAAAPVRPPAPAAPPAGNDDLDFIGKS